MVLPSGPRTVEDDVVESLQFAGAMDQRMAGDDLLDQRGARSAACR